MCSCQVAGERGDPLLRVERLHLREPPLLPAADSLGEVIEAMASLGLSPISTTIKKE